jgi:hypothetical protein
LRDAGQEESTGIKAAFIETTDCLPVTKLPDSPDWTYEIELNGFRLEAVKDSGETTPYSRRKNVGSADRLGA